MPIFHYRNSNELVKTTYEGAVIEVRNYTARRNMSDTMDYTDFRTVDCTDALVWLGEIGRPYGNEWLPVRTLEYYEQFVWVDCSNHFSWRTDGYLRPEVDASPAAQPLMFANLLAWRQHVLAETKRKTLEADQLKADLEEKELKKKQADEAAELAARHLLETYAPPKGTMVTVNDITGNVFWSGVKKYRGKWKTTVGVKDRHGNAHWIDISHWVKK
jgi:hypothetical protein